MSCAQEPARTLEPIVKVGTFAPELQARIDGEFRCMDPETVLADEALRRSVRALVTRSNYQVSRALVDRLPGLRIIATCGVGFDGIPVDEARRRAIVVTNTPGVLDAAVCELGIGLLLALLRRIPEADLHVRSGAWQAQPFPLTTSLQGLRIGIVGLGRIGAAMALRLAVFGVRLAYSGRRKPDLPWDHFPSAVELAANVDVLLVCCKGGEETRHLVNAEVLVALGRGWLVNMSRGSVIDEQALIAALTQGDLRGAALDVFEHEPLRDSPLRQLPSVLLSPHAGSGTEQARTQMVRLTLDNLHRVLDGRPALTPVA